MSERDEFGGYTEREAMEIMGMPVPAPTPLQSRPMIPAEAVEAAAKALAETCDPLGDWEKQAEAYRGIYRRRIMPALKAAAPYMMAPRLDSTLNPEYPDGKWEEL